MSDGFVRIARFPSSFLGQLAAGRLEAEGLFAIAVDDTVEGVVVASAVYVREADAERARAALDRPDDEAPAEPEPDEAAEDAPVDDGDPALALPRAAVPPAPPAPPPGARCPSCGSTEVGEDLRLLPFLPARRRCLRCRTPLSRRRPREARP